MSVHEPAPAAPLPPAPDAVLGPDGNPRLGAYLGVPPRIGLGGLAAPYRRGAVQSFLRHKRWMYVFAATEDLVVAAAIVDAGPTGTSFVMVTDRTTGNVIADASRPGAVRPLVGLNDRPEEGFRAHYYTPGTTVMMRGDSGHLRTTARIHRFPFVPRVSQPWIDLELELATAAQPGVTAIVDLHTVPPSVTTTAKKAGLLISGRLVVRDRGGQSARWELSGGYGGFDFTSGHLPRETSWRWAYGTGRTSTGRTAGVNLTCGFTGMEDRASENSLWLDGRIIPLDPSARIDCDNADLMAPWQIKTLDGATDLTFRPMGLHRENLNLGVVRSYFVQAQGHITGTIRAGAEMLTLDRFPAVTEDQRVLW
ncbi:MAG: DUF2804 domain-containing protein [Frankiaceae bacterium]